MIRLIAILIFFCFLGCQKQKDLFYSKNLVNELVNEVKKIDSELNSKSTVKITLPKFSEITLFLKTDKSKYFLISPHELYYLFKSDKNYHKYGSVNEFFYLAINNKILFNEKKLTESELKSAFVLDKKVESKYKSLKFDEFINYYTLFESRNKNKKEFDKSKAITREAYLSVFYFLSLNGYYLSQDDLTGFHYIYKYNIANLRN